MVLDINLPNLITFVISLLVFCGVMFDAIRMRVKIRILDRQNLQLEIDKVTLISQLNQINMENDIKSVEKTDGFLKFVSDSRDWAFDYIEDVQQALRAYDMALGMDDAQILNEAYKKLIDLLPKE